jgi:hypothetical protein
MMRRRFAAFFTSTQYCATTRPQEMDAQVLGGFFKLGLSYDTRRRQEQHWLLSNDKRKAFRATCSGAFFQRNHRNVPPPSIWPKIAEFIFHNVDYYIISLVDCAQLIWWCFD